MSIKRKFKRLQMQKKTRDVDHAYGEAFMVMEYECDTCKTVEKIWNSRNGVTPFMIGCRYCDGISKHKNWNKDIFNPSYQPQPGERIFYGSHDSPRIKVVEETLQ